MFKTIVLFVRRKLQVFVSIECTIIIIAICSHTQIFIVELRLYVPYVCFSQLYNFKKYPNPKSH